ncbi:receptor-like protein EIX2 [Senna tora]|uniref:Receptor-like protein EIX2 n=1 Tax=Senna tora TaxID=362788 RepID=A0A834TI95_9FABA|nr:receptor-like protein EIX2 [Senna tora]
MGVGFVVGFCIRAWRYRFFRWFDGVVDGVYVSMAL